MQESLFISEPFISFERPVYPSVGNSLFTEADRRNLLLEEAEYTRWYCVREVLCEQYLWDMRCWDKPKYLYSKEEIIEHINKWIKDHEEGNETNNCGHCLYCIRRLHNKYGLPMEEIADLVKKNNNLKYYNQIKTWNNGFEEEKGSIVL
jgi:hypothetical protein